MPSFWSGFTIVNEDDNVFFEGGELMPYYPLLVHFTMWPVRSLSISIKDKHHLDRISSDGRMST
jgi:hypothetical protein